MTLLETIRRGLDGEPTPGHVLARVIRLERILEKESGQSLEKLEAKLNQGGPPQGAPAPAVVAGGAPFIPDDKKAG